MNITPGKYRTRDGGVAYVLKNTGLKYEPIIGYMIGGEDGYQYPTAMTWETDGSRYSFPDEYDLMERIE